MEKETFTNSRLRRSGKKQKGSRMQPKKKHSKEVLPRKKPNRFSKEFTMSKCYVCNKKVCLLLKPRKKLKRKKSGIKGSQRNQRDRAMKIGEGSEAIGHRTIDKVATGERGALVTATTTRIENGGEGTKMIPGDQIVVVIEMTEKRMRVDGTSVESLAMKKGETNEMMDGEKKGEPLNQEEMTEMGQEEMIEMKDAKSDGTSVEDHQAKKGKQRNCWSRKN
mmetsp:Transcript_18183/g.26922  ORF Transcript_18183/g.26922 Transcript_18183/m.26922 type:complete len:221 (+) Transcript_18183:1338-2000(+)